MVLDDSVTLYSLSLGARDSTTGWRELSYIPSTISCYRFPRGASGAPYAPGTYAREDAMFITQDSVYDGDLLKTLDLTYYEAVTVQEWWNLDSFEYREVQAHELPIYQVPPSSTASWKTGPGDARSRTKIHIDTYARNASILKDDGVTQASWACMFANPPYPLRLEFRGSSNMHGLYVVDSPTSTPRMNPLTGTPSGYDESVPIHIVTVDSTGCSGHQLQWRMEAELRYVYETYSTGSWRGLERRSSTDHILGSMKLYDTTFTINYKRGLTI